MFLLSLVSFSISFADLHCQTALIIGFFWYESLSEKEPEYYFQCLVWSTLFHSRTNWSRLPLIDRMQRMYKFRNFNQICMSQYHTWLFMHMLLQLVTILLIRAFQTYSKTLLILKGTIRLTHWNDIFNSRYVLLLIRPQKHVYLKINFKK